MFKNEFRSLTSFSISLLPLPLQDGALINLDETVAALNNCKVVVEIKKGRQQQVAARSKCSYENNISEFKC